MEVPGETVALSQVRRVPPEDAVQGNGGIVPELELEQLVGDVDPGIVELAPQRGCRRADRGRRPPCRPARPSIRDRPDRAGGLARGSPPGPGVSSPRRADSGRCAGSSWASARRAARASFKVFSASSSRPRSARTWPTACWLAARSARWRRLRGSSCGQLGPDRQGASCRALSFSSGVPDSPCRARAAASSSAFFRATSAWKSARPRRTARSSSVRMCRDGLRSPSRSTGGGHRSRRRSAGRAPGDPRPVKPPDRAPIAAAARARTQARLYRSPAGLPRLVLHRRGRQAKPLGRLGLPALGQEDASELEWRPNRVGPGRPVPRGSRASCAASARSLSDRPGSPHRAGPGPGAFDATLLYCVPR